MPVTKQPQTYSAKDYDPRWFIWTIVVLVVTGVSLVSYIMLSTNTAEEFPGNVTSASMIH